MKIHGIGWAELASDGTPSTGKGGCAKNADDLAKQIQGLGGLIMTWPLVGMDEEQRQAARKAGVRDSNPWESWPVIAELEGGVEA